MKISSAIRCLMIWMHRLLRIEDMDYGIWYVDMMDNPEKYKGKVVEIQGRARKAKGFPKGEFVLGRSAMTCCADVLHSLALSASIWQSKI